MKPTAVNYLRLTGKWFEQQAGPGRPSLVKAIFKTFWREYGVLGFITIINDIVIRLAQPIFLGWLLMYFRKDTEVTRESAFLYAGAIVLLNALSVITINQYVLGSFQNGMKVRIAVCSVIYRKALRLSRTALGDTAPGKVVNLLSNDVNRFDIVSVFLHSMWSAPLLAIIIGVLLYLEIGVAGLIGMIVIFIVTPIQSARFFYCQRTVKTRLTATGSAYAPVQRRKVAAVIERTGLLCAFLRLCAVA
ncbi:AGAP012467-PA [Anopheles gambiae str. PEST]|uniref:AGAP012467-PA n=1 Tax=Anopheles gambiae TaxID=7165 RepID=Q5TSV5_ANOGA|nr:AGAP012467-PA [Anopheles gambiae str. PEST]